MHTLIVAFYFFLSLIGCGDFGTHSVVTQVIEQGVEVLHSEASITPLQARFSCISSAKSHCHYRVVMNECRNAAGSASLSACRRNVTRQFLLDAGRSEVLTDLPAGFSFCVDQAALSNNAPCRSEQSSGLSL